MIGVKLGAKAKNYDFDVTDINFDAIKGRDPSYAINRDGITISEDRSNYVQLKGDFRLWPLLSGDYEKGIKELDAITIVEQGRVSYTASGLNVAGKEIATGKLLAEFLSTQTFAIKGNGFDNDLTGGRLGDVLRGMGGADELYGLGGNDRLLGGNGRDRLNGGEGDDILAGGKGADRFVFASGDGDDVITDFKAFGRDRDVIDLSGHDDVQSFADLEISSKGRTVTIGVGEDSITLRNVLVARIDESDFLF
jgi:hypothetical protein